MVFVLSCTLLAVFYVFLPLFYFESVPIPAACIDNAAHFRSSLPATLDATLPGIGTGTLLTSDAQSALVVMTDYTASPLSTTVYLIDKNNRQVLNSLHFEKDGVSAAFHNGTLYLFNDLLLYLFDAHTGAFVHDSVKIDNFRGVYASNNALYLQTTLTISAIDSHGHFLPQLNLHLAGIAFGCFFP